MKSFRIRFALLFLTCLALLANSSFAWQSQPEPDTGARRRIDSESIIIMWSEGNDELRGFSNKLGVWEILKIEPQKRIMPTVGGTVGAVRIGDSVAAYSGDTGSWDVVDLSRDSTAIITADKELITTQDGEHLYTFAATLGSWTSPTDPELKAAEGELSIRLNSPAYDKFYAWVQTLPKYKRSNIRANRQKSAALGLMKLKVYASRQSWLAEAVSKLEELEQSEQSERSRAHADDSGSATTSPASKDSMLGKKAIVAKESANDEESSRLIRELQNKVVDAENRAIEMGKSLAADSAPSDEDRRKFKNLVANSFDARQVLQSLEAKQMRAKLEKVDENLASRRKLRDRIIERRVEELLEPNSEATAWLDKLTDVKAKLDPTSQTQPRPNSLQLAKPEVPVRDATSIQLSNPDTMPAMRRPSEFVTMLRDDYKRVDQTANDRDLRAEIASLTKEIEQIGDRNRGHTEYLRQLLNQKNGNLKGSQILFQERMRDWKRDWSEYQSQLKFLRLDVEEAKANLDLKKKKADYFTARYERGVASAREGADSKSDLNIAEFRLLRVTELYNLYAAIETSEPKLNPDSFKPEIVDSGSVSEPLP